MLNRGICRAQLIHLLEYIKTQPEPKTQLLLLVITHNLTYTPSKNHYSSAMGKVIFTTRKGAPDFNLQRKFNRRCQTLFTKASELVYLSQADVYVVVQFPGARTRARVFLSSEGFTPLPLPELV